MFSFVANFKKLTFTRLFFWKLSSKSAWCSPVNCRKELPQVSFLCIPRTTTVPQTFLAATLLWSYSCKKEYSITITKKIFKQKRFYKKLFQTNQKKKLGRFDTLAPVFFCEFCKILRMSFSHNTSGGCFWYSDASSFNLWFKSIFAIFSDKPYISHSVSFYVGAFFIVAWISTLICFLVGPFLATPCKTASEEK